LSECDIPLDGCWRVDHSELAWFDGSTVGVSINALKGVDFEHFVFDASAHAIAALSAQAFETLMESEAGPTDSGTSTTRVLGPDVHAVNRYRIQAALDRVGSLMLEVSDALPAVAGLSPRQARRSGGLTVMRAGAGGELSPLLSMDMSQATEAHRETMARLSQALASTMLSGGACGDKPGDGALVMQGMPLMWSGMSAGERCRAALEIGPGEWVEVDGPTRGPAVLPGREFWLEDSSDPHALRRAYVRILDSRVLCCEINADEKAEERAAMPPRQR